MPSSSKGKVDKTVAFLSKRDGIDKVLKLAKYLSSLGVELSHGGEGGGASSGGRGGGKLKDLESALSLSRKAFRLGKFLGNVNKLVELRERERKRAEDAARREVGKGDGFRKLVEENYFLSRRTFLVLSLVNNCSEGLYYFLDQLQFLVKAKVLKKSDTIKGIKRTAAVAELLSYVADTLLLVLDGKSGEDMCFSTMQNLADFLMALDDIRDSEGGLGDPRFLSCLGLVSALIGIRSKWKK
mmetsp:Transcript_5066/g.15190  ORF Transcript_5066/g.15190 Transcript_5066/m.15190 type:complete len:241 (-) Transcript_5066:1574-2296(-)